MKTVFIYAENDPRSRRTRYIGKSNRPKVRHAAHLRLARQGEQSHKANWIRELSALELAPELEILDEVPEIEWEFWECEYIRLYRLLNFKLTNATPGGEGISWPGEAHPNWGKSLPAVTRAKISKANTGKHHSPETCEKMRAAQLATPNHSTRGRFGPEHPAFGCRWEKAPESVLWGDAHPRFGKPPSPLAVERSCATRRGRPLSESHRAKLVLAQQRRRERERVEKNNGV